MFTLTREDQDISFCSSLRGPIFNRALEILRDEKIMGPHSWMILPSIYEVYERDLLPVISGLNFSNITIDEITTNTKFSKLRLLHADCKYNRHCVTEYHVKNKFSILGHGNFSWKWLINYCS